MTIQWFTPRDHGSPWVSKSADGYYAIGTPVMGEYGAYHVEALWATPEQIGNADSISSAQALCQKHRDALSAEYATNHQ